MEISEVVDFFEQTTPFCYLTSAEIAALAKQLHISYSRSGEVVSGESGRLMIVRTGRFTLSDYKREVLTQLQPGDTYGYQAILAGQPANHTINCEEDGLLYWLPAQAFNLQRSKNAHFDGYFQGLSHHTLHQFQEPQQSERITLKVMDLIERREVIIAPDASAQQAAEMMTENRVSSLLVKQNEQLLGIVTDRDLRSRVLAKAMPSSTPLHRIMTSSPYTIDKSAYLFEAVQLMSEHNIHHLPVLDGGRGYSMITLTDIVRAQQNHPLHLIGEIHRQQELKGLVTASERLPALLMQLEQQQVPAREAGRIITTITDALTKTLIKIAQRQLGEAPCTFSWLAFGSQARMDQSLNADQDNALLLERELTQAEAQYFKQLAELVCHGLDQCGIVLCPGNIMATNDALRLNLQEWKQKIDSLINRPDPQAILNSSIFFDMRGIAGYSPLSNELQQYITSCARGNQLFLYHMARTALQRTSPIGLFKQFILQDEGKGGAGVDLKKRGMSIITDVTRVYALDAGISENDTRKRLRRLQQIRAMDADRADDLLAAFEVFAQLRWQHHLRQLKAGKPIHNLIDPSRLHVLQRHQLKDAFAVVNEAQSRLQQKFCRSL